VNEPGAPQWSVSFFENTRIGDRMNMQANPTFDAVNTTSQINFARTTPLGLRFRF
jgi:hypothetical protein